MLLREAVKKFYPELVTPDLTRRTSKAHWHKERNKSKRERAAAILAEPKASTIYSKLIHVMDDFPVVDVCDDDIDFCVSTKVYSVEITVSDTDLLNCDIEITGKCREKLLIELINNLIERVANQHV